MSTETKLTLAEMVTEALKADSERRAVLNGEIASLRFPCPVGVPRYYSGATTSALLSCVMTLAEEAKRPLHRIAIVAAIWLADEQRAGALKSPQRFYVQPANPKFWGEIGGAELYADAGGGKLTVVHQCLFPSEIEHVWQGYFEFWAERQICHFGNFWRLILPEEFRGH
jgi:hypothetical protein